MRVSYKWLKEYVECELSPEELAEKLSMAGCAVEGIEYQHQGIDKVVVGRAISVEKHPNADSLFVCQVDVGNEVVQIVTGATNVHPGDVIPTALHGSTLPGGVKIKKSKLRGIESDGMMCSAQELNLPLENLPPEQQHGIYILPPDTPIGEDIKKVLGMDDVILEFELTPNRGDCLSMIGIAREVAALLGTAVKMPDCKVEESTLEAFPLAKIGIKDQNLCPRFSARLFTDIKIGPSPEWMQRRLEAAGMRPINNIVDITNYVMLELGQPLHAYDYDLLAGHCLVARQAAEGERIITIDNLERELEPGMLVIADAEKPVSVAGVMGGLHTEITEKTKTMLLESANFNNISVRKTSKKLGLRSEASNRFEKGVDPNGTVRALNRAAHLIALLGAGKPAKGVIDNYPHTIEPRTIILHPERANCFLGANLDKQTMVDILCRLQFDVEDGEQIKVTVPTFRPDISEEPDLYEEIARIYGFENIDATLPAGRMPHGKFTFEQKCEDTVRYTLAECGMEEVVTFSLTTPKVFDLIRIPVDSPLRNVVKVRNPLSEEHSVLRTTLIPNALEVIARNVARRQRDISIFEVALVYLPNGEVSETNLPDERLHICGAMTGMYNAPHWATLSRPCDFYDLKGVVEHLLAKFGISKTEFPPSDHPTLHPGRAAKIVANGLVIGDIGEIHPLVQEAYGLNQRVYVFEIDFRRLLERSKIVRLFKPLPKYPATTRDLAVVIPDTIPAQDVRELIERTGRGLLESVTLFDVYQGEQIPAGHKSLAYALVYRAADRTLTDEEVNTTHEKIMQALREKMHASLRA